MPKWTAQWDTSPFLKDKDEDKYILDPAQAEKAAACRDSRVSDAATKPAKQSPPAPFTNATLLQAASAALASNPTRRLLA